MKRRVLTFIVAVCAAFSVCSATVTAGDGDNYGNDLFFDDDMHVLPVTYDDSAVINAANLRYFCNTNVSMIEGAIKGIILEFGDLNNQSVLGGQTDVSGVYNTSFSTACAENGIIIAYVQSGVWSWGNKAVVRLADDIVGFLADQYSLPEGFPLVVCGGGMGGLAALIYAADSSYALSACAAACPCTNVIESFNSSASMPRTFVSAVAGYDMPLAEALCAVSPEHRVGELPDIPYFICSAGNDALYSEALCTRFVELLGVKVSDVTYRQQPGFGHGQFSSAVKTEFQNFLIQSVLDPAESDEGTKLPLKEMPSGASYDDSDVINASNITLFANTNEHLITGEVKGVIVELPGLGGSSCLGGNINMGNYGSAFASRCAENGIVLAYIFPGPWSWGSRAAVRITDAVIAAVADKYSLPEGFPVAVCGGSMGGLGSLIFAADTSYTLVACAAACPCTDVIANFASSASYPRTFFSAVGYYDMPIQDALRKISPTHRLDDMPDIPYFICSDADDEVFAEALCDEYTGDLADRVASVIYRRQPGKTHGQFVPEVLSELRDFLVNNVLGITDVLAGDADGDGDITAGDAALVLQKVASYDVTIDLTAADANGNGDIDAGDAALILQYVAGYSVTLGAA